MRHPAKRTTGRVLTKLKRACAIERSAADSPLRSASVRKAFRQASAKVKEERGRVDPKLRHGELGVNEAVQALLEAKGLTNHHVYYISISKRPCRTLHSITVLLGGLSLRRKEHHDC